MQLDAVRPTVTEDAVELLSTRHPLLGPGAVPIDLRLGERFGYRALVVTGPNTGGKTVSLKTLGLLALMHQAGLRVPAASGARLPVFSRVMADIDRQIAGLDAAPIPNSRVPAHLERAAATV